jgi:methylmalonyl-CoA mutase cobalamin-binding subunit
VLCLAASDQADLVAARWLVTLLGREGVRAESRPAGGLRGEGASEAIPGKVDVVIVSAMPPEAVTQARYLCRRLRHRLPEVPIIVGLWCARGDIGKARERLESVGATAVVSTFADCLDSLAEVVRRPADAAGEPGGNPVAAQPHHVSG